MFSNQIAFTLTQAIQIAAFIQCIFLALYFIIIEKNKKLAVIPVLYFISLASGLLFRLLPALFLEPQQYRVVAFSLVFADNMLPALSFLLIFQMTFSAVPPRLFWWILAVPAIATTPFIYGFINDTIACTSAIDTCFPSEYALHLNIAVISSFIFMLLITIFSRRAEEIEGDTTAKKHKYWLIICLVLYNLILIAVEVGFVAEFISLERYIFSKAMINIAFIYMIMTSIFRVVGGRAEALQKNIQNVKSGLSEYEKSVGVRAEKILNTEKIYRETGFNRANFAKKLGVREHLLSRVINLYFKKSFSELANEYRIAEAKLLLANKDLSVTTISYDVGFSSITSFNRVFKEATGFSPSEFRELPQKSDIVEKPDA